MSMYDKYLKYISPWTALKPYVNADTDAFRFIHVQRELIYKTDDRDILL